MWVCQEVVSSHSSWEYKLSLTVWADMTRLSTKLSVFQCVIYSCGQWWRCLPLGHVTLLCINALIGSIVHLFIEEQAVKPLKFIVRLSAVYSQAFNTLSEFLIMSHTFSLIVLKELTASLCHVQVIILLGLLRRLRCLVRYSEVCTS